MPSLLNFICVIPATSLAASAKATVVEFVFATPPLIEIEPVGPVVSITIAFVSAIFCPADIDGFVAVFPKESVIVPITELTLKSVEFCPAPTIYDPL